MEKQFWGWGAQIIEVNKYTLYSRHIIKFSVLCREVNSGNWTLVTSIYTLNSAEPKWCAVSYIYFTRVPMPQFLSHLKRAIQYLFSKWIMPYFYLFHIYTKIFSCSLAWVFRQWSWWIFLFMQLHVLT